MRILVVEDEKKVASFIKRGLEEEQFTVDVAYDGEEGVQMAENTTYDWFLWMSCFPKRWIKCNQGTARKKSCHSNSLPHGKGYRG